MKTIPLTQQQVAIVDDDDFQFISQFKWNALKSRSGFYAVRSIKTSNGKKTLESMHRAIMSPLPGFHIDHVNRDTLDNRRLNLRCVTKQMNGWNRSFNGNNQSKYKGVGFDSSRNRPCKFRARAMINGKQNRIGWFKTAEAAARAYDRYVSEKIGPLATLNFPGVDK